jgi:hypothetical protein
MRPRTIILPVVLYGSETWSLTLREERRLRAFENRGLRVRKSRRIRWAGYVARIGEKRGVYRVWWRNLRGRDHWGDPGVDGRIILRWIIKKWIVGVWIGSSWFRIGTGDGHLWMR